MIQFQVQGPTHDLIVTAEDILQNKMYTECSRFLPIMWGTDSDRMLLERGLLRAVYGDGSVCHSEAVEALEVFTLMEAYGVEELVKCIAVAQEYKKYMLVVPSLRECMLDRWRIATVQNISGLHFLSVHGKEWAYSLSPDIDPNA